MRVSHSRGPYISLKNLSSSVCIDILCIPVSPHIVPYFYGGLRVLSETIANVEAVLGHGVRYGISTLSLCFSSLLCSCISVRVPLFSHFVPYVILTDASHLIVDATVNGGTLYFWMRKMGLFTEPQAQFFAAELLLALEHLHSHNIVCTFP